jgi:hypothetical protein
LKRGGFKPKVFQRPPRAPLVPVTSCNTGPVEREPVQVAKDVKAKPGKRAPTAQERAWMDAIVQFGCVACNLDKGPPRPAAVHHILRGGRRLGHLFTIPLCDPGHHQGGEALGMISRHPWKARFEERYGTEESLRQYVATTLAVDLL